MDVAATLLVPSMSSKNNKNTHRLEMQGKNQNSSFSVCTSQKCRAEIAQNGIALHLSASDVFYEEK